jgi:hypothetical protein
VLLAEFFSSPIPLFDLPITLNLVRSVMGKCRLNLIHGQVRALSPNRIYIPMLGNMVKGDGNNLSPGASDQRQSAGIQLHCW